MNDQKKIAYVAGIVGNDPEVKQTSIGQLVQFRLGVTAGYPQQGEQYGQTDWYDVIVKNTGLGQSVLNEIYKGAKVMAQGNVQEKSYNGKPQFSIWADRVGLVEFLRREQVAAPAPVAAPAGDDELGF